MKNISILSCIIFSLNCIGLNVTPETTDTPHDFVSQPVSPNPGYMQNFYLENGLEVLTIYNNASPMVCLNTTVRVGSAFEDYKTSGMSHMLEHLLFNGTESRSQEELYEQTDDLGAYSNAYTSNYFTDFILLLPAQYLKDGMNIQSDMLFHSVMPDDKLEKERGIVIEEIRKDRDRESTHIQNAFARMTYGDNGEGFPTLGTISTIRHMSRKDIWDFYQTHYVPNNMILTVIGNFDPEQIRQQLEAYYGGEAPGNLPDSPLNLDRSRHFTDYPDLDQVVLDVDKYHGQIIFGLGSDAPEDRTESQYLTTSRRFVSEMMVEWIGESMSESFPENHLSIDLLSDPFYSGIIVNFSTGRDEDLQKLMETIVSSVYREKEELRTQINEKKITSWIKKRQVEEFSYLDQPHYYGMMKADVLATQGGTGVISSSLILPTMNLADVREEIGRLQLNLSRFNIVQPVPIKDTEQSNDEIKYEKSILPSGATLITSTGGGSEIMGMHILIKNRSVLEGELSGGVEILHSLLESGTNQFSKEQIAEMIGEIGATTKFVDMGFIPYDDYYNSTEYGYLRAECLDSDAEALIRLVSHLMSNTILDDDKVNAAVDNARGRLMRQKSTARETARIEYNKMFLGQDHPSAGNVSGNSESLDRINTAKLRELQQRYFSPPNYIITISSRLPHSFYKDLFNELFSGNDQPVKRVTYPVSQNVKKVTREIDLGKEQAQILLGYKFRIEDSDVQAFSLLSDILSYRMMFDLREKQGLAYTLGITDGHENDLGWMTAYIGTGIENIDIALEGMKKYFDPDAISDLDDKEIRKTVNAGKGRYLRRNLTRIGQAFYLGYYEYYFDDYHRAITRYDKLDTITADQLFQVADKYLQLPENYTLLIVK